MDNMIHNEIGYHDIFDKIYEILDYEDEILMATRNRDYRRLDEIDNYRNDATWDIISLLGTPGTLTTVMGLTTPPIVLIDQTTVLINGKSIDLLDEDGVSQFHNELGSLDN